MAEKHEINPALTDIERTIAVEKAAFALQKAKMQTSSGNLGLIPTQFADVIATIDAYTPGLEVTPENIDEHLWKKRRETITTDFLALKALIDAQIATF